MINNTHVYRIIRRLGLLILVVSVSFPVTAQIIAIPNQDLVLENRDLVIKDANGQERTRLDAQSGDWIVRDESGDIIGRMEVFGRNFRLGGNGRAGDLVLLPRGAPNVALDNASIHFDGNNGTGILGGGGTDGQLVLRDAEDKQRILLSGDAGDIILGQNGSAGTVVVRTSTGDQTIRLEGENGQVLAKQIVSSHSGSGDSDGVDTASIYVKSRNPAIGLLDTTGGNTKGWYIQSGSAGQLVFSAGTTSGLDATVFTLSPDGAVCLGAAC